VRVPPLFEGTPRAVPDSFVFTTSHDACFAQFYGMPMRSDTDGTSEKETDNHDAS
jgi:hypothetical protein